MFWILLVYLKSKNILISRYFEISLNLVTLDGREGAFSRQSHHKRNESKQDSYRLSFQNRLRVCESD